MSRSKSPFVWFILALFTTAVLTVLGPQEQSLGDNSQIIYLQAAWTLTAETTLALSAIAGLLGILARRERLHRWSDALGRSGVSFWVVLLPLSLWAMQTSWNELFGSELRFRAIVIFAAVGIFLQIVLSLANRPALTSLSNVLFFAALQIGLLQAKNVPQATSIPGPVFGELALQLFYVGLVFLTMAAAYFMTRWWLQRQG
jgi:hypothetical protein